MSPLSPRQEQDTKRALLDAREEAVRASQSPSWDTPRRRHSFLRWLLILTVLAAAYLFLARPPWFITPPPPPESYEVAEASLRIAVWQTAMRVRAFQQEEGRLPQTLAEAGAPQYRGVEYNVMGEGEFSIRASSDRLDVTYRSKDNLEAFLGNSLTVVAHRGGGH